MRAVLGICMPDSPLARWSERLTETRFIPWRFRHLGGPLNTLFCAPWRKRALPRLLAQRDKGRPDDISVIIPVRGRVDYRIRNNLIGLRGQDYPRDLTRIVVVDYGSEPADSGSLQILCEEFGAEHVRVANCSPWQRAHCLNIGIKRAATQFIMPLDVDLILSPNYISVSIEAIKAKALALPVSPMLDLPEHVKPHLEEIATRNSPLDAALLRSKATRRSARPFHETLYVTYVDVHRLIRGYDEYFKHWGSEDEDVFKRFLYLGLEPVDISDRAYYLHQWHPKYEGVASPDLSDIVKSNAEYFLHTHSICRNPMGWGEFESAKGQGRG